MTTTKFAVEVAKYFRDFLETNFHKRKAPKRSIKNRNDKNLLTGINLKTFDGLRNQIFKNVANSLRETISIEKGRYTHGVNKTVLEIIARYCDSLNTADIQTIESNLQKDASAIIDSHTDDLNLCKDKIEDQIREVVAKKFFDPIIQLISSSLINDHSFEEDMVDGLREEMREILDQKAKSLASDYVIANLVEKKSIPLRLTDLITLVSLKEDIKTYFGSLKIEDLFYELNEIINNSEIIDKQQLYLYLFDIKFAGSRYPLFYVPIETQKLSDTITLSFDSVMYINKKAVDFIVENLNKTKDKRGKIKSIDNRIIHLGESEASLSSIVENVANEIMNYCKIDGLFNFSKGGTQSFRYGDIAMANSCHLSLFDKSDEALVNDYEELISILSLNGELGGEFCKLLEGFLTQEPIKIISEIEREWEDTEVQERLVNISPIALNEEQNQIISALKKESCKYVVVEGPPGTGKSHTITALAFNAILEHKSILVLSDKKEALDVVEDKITDTLNGVRLSEDFQNPILRLGKAGNTYSKILSSESITNIKHHFKAISKNKIGLHQKINEITKNLKDKIKSEISEYANIDLNEIHRLEQLEFLFNQKSLLFISDEEFQNDGQGLIEDLENLHQIACDVSFLLEENSNPTIIEFRKLYADPISFDNLSRFLKLLEVANSLKITGIDPMLFSKIQGLDLQSLNKFKSIIFRLEDLGRGIFGYWFKKSALNSLLMEFRSKFDCPEIVNLKEHNSFLQTVMIAFESLETELKKSALYGIQFSRKVEECISRLLSLDLGKSINDINELLKDLEEVSDFITNYPKTSQSIGLSDFSSMRNSRISTLEDEELNSVCEYLRLRIKVEKTFRNIPQYDYAKNKNAIELLYTAEMTHILDERVINFSENFSAKAKTLKKIISAKKRFPKEEFNSLKEAFPCIIAGIRDYAEYIPLDKALFDLVIIDEASQVSIAQALPAILRAKKVIVFGDKRQFSNIKSAQAKSEVNQQYVQNIKTSFLDSKSPSTSELERLSKFNIKTSVLDFFEYICNYTMMLRKHFRGYKELISYSSKYFYQNHLQAIKIRGKNIDDVLQFISVEHDEKLDMIENTNTLEIDKIIEYIEKICAKNGSPSIGIITPHTNQQKLLSDRISLHRDAEDFKKKNKIKIMTFDTCQGEERDIILYSMVASRVNDKLGFIFIKDLKDIDFDEENKIKAQRLNVGFSRAKEKMVFFLSKPISEYTGSIGEAIRHFENTLIQARKLPTASDVDPKSTMEMKVLNWIQETTFFKENSNSVELKAQFPIGEYLKQLNPMYSHPKYVSDFLLIFRDDYRSYQIVIEYDGFKEHFTKLSAVSEYNYSSYYKDEDVFREKVLEGYGYKFLRINRFNIGTDPIASLDLRIRQLIKNGGENTNPSFVKDIQAMVLNLEEGTLRECIKCGKLRELSEFKDSSLITGTGRYCQSCKSKPAIRKRKRRHRSSSDLPQPSALSACPKCGSVMRTKSGRYGKFLSCSRYPACRGARNIA